MFYAFFSFDGPATSVFHLVFPIVRLFGSPRLPSPKTPPPTGASAPRKAKGEGPERCTSYSLHTIRAARRLTAGLQARTDGSALCTPLSPWSQSPPPPPLPVTPVRRPGQEGRMGGKPDPEVLPRFLLLHVTFSPIPFTARTERPARPQVTPPAPIKRSAARGARGRVAGGISVHQCRRPHEPP